MRFVVALSRLLILLSPDRKGIYHIFLWNGSTGFGLVLLHIHKKQEQFPFPFIETKLKPAASICLDLFIWSSSFIFWFPQAFFFLTMPPFPLLIPMVMDGSARPAKALRFKFYRTKHVVLVFESGSREHETKKKY